MERLDLDGGHLAYVDAGAGTSPVVLLHAGFVDHRMWDREIAHLAGRTRVVAPDARAHGESVTPLTPFRQCDDIAALVRHLDSGPAVLVGVSMGAGSAVDTALEHPDVVRALVLSGAGTNEPDFAGTAELALLGQLERAQQAMDADSWLAAALEWVAGPDRSLAEVDPAVTTRVRSMQQHFVATHVRPGVVPPGHVTGSWDRLPEITVPVLGIVGELDFSDHLRMCERAVRSVQDGQGVVRIPGAGHYPNLERPREWSEAVDAFLDDLGMDGVPGPPGR